MSRKVEIETGLPQGSVIAPITLNVYINDINTALKYCKINLFADDTLLTVSDRNLHKAVTKMQEGLDSLYNWLCVNKLKLNVTKTKFIILSRAISASFGDHSLQIKNERIEEVKVIKYLGIYIDNKLKFEDHVEYTVIKIAKKIGLLKRSCKYIGKRYKVWFIDQ